MATTVQVPFLDLKGQFAPLRDEVLEAVADVLDSQRCILGPHVTQLEARVAAWSQCDHAVGVSSGTDGLVAALMTLGIGPGDEVITTVFSFFATVGSIVRVGARPVFVDIDPRTFNLDAAQLEAAVTERTRAIMPVHLYGQMADMDTIMAVAERHGLAVIEDAAQAIGSEYQGRRAGSFGTAGVFSFYPTKNLGGAGDGGMVVTRDEAFADRLRVIRDHGQSPKYHYKMIGGNFRLDELQAAVLLVKIKHLEQWLAARRTRARYYDAHFAGTDVTPPYVAEGCTHVYNLYCIRAPRRDELMAHLRARGVGCDIYYPIPLHQHDCFADLGHAAGAFPRAEQAAADILALPMFPELTETMQEHVVKTTLEFYRG